jgi:hypothetical protein
MWTSILIIAASIGVVAAAALAGKHDSYRPEITIPVVAILSVVIAAGFSLISDAGGGG